MSAAADNDVSQSIGSAFWLESDPKKRADAAMEAVDRMEIAQEYRRENDLMHASLYGNVDVFGFSPKTYGARTPRAHARLSLNVVRNVTSTVISKIAAKNKIAPKFMTDGGDASLQRKAQGMEKAANGILYANRFERLKRRVFRDVAVIGTGFVRPWVDELRRKVTIERVAPWNILVDDEESEDADPKTLFYRRWYDRRVLAKMFPGATETIRAAGKRPPKGDVAFNGEVPANGDIIAVYEGFRRPSIFGSDDGMRILFVDSGELASVPWNHDYHPFPKLVWSDELAGFWGTGIAYELAGIQAEINDILLEFARAHRLVKGGWFVEMASKVTLKHINDDLGKIIRYAGAVPQYIQPVAIPDATYRYLWDLYARAYDICGVPQLVASGQKPAGLNSGEAQRVYLDEASDRFLDIGTSLEEFYREVVEQSMDRAWELAEDEEGGGFKVRARNDSEGEVIDFREVRLDPGTYDVEIFPTSQLPHTPAGRLAFVSDLIEMGIVSDEGEALKLLGYPDLKSFMARKNAPRDLLDKNIESIVANGKWASPEPLDDHELALVEVPLALAQARNKGVEPERLTMLRRYVVLSARLQQLKQAGQIDGAITDADPSAAPPADPNAPPPGAPPPGPMAPPPGLSPMEQMATA